MSLAILDLLVSKKEQKILENEVMPPHLIPHPGVLFVNCAFVPLVSGSDPIDAHKFSEVPVCQIRSHFPDSLEQLPWDILPMLARIQRSILNGYDVLNAHRSRGRRLRAGHPGNQIPCESPPRWLGRSSLHSAPRRRSASTI